MKTTFRIMQVCLALAFILFGLSFAFEAYETQSNLLTASLVSALISGACLITNIVRINRK